MYWNYQLVDSLDCALPPQARENLGSAVANLANLGYKLQGFIIPFRNHLSKSSEPFVLYFIIDILLP